MCHSHCDCRYRRTTGRVQAGGEKATGLLRLNARLFAYPGLSRLEDVHRELNALSKRGRWDEMTDLISDDILESIAVVGERHEIAAKLTARLDGIADSVSLTHNRCPDPGYWADIVAELKRHGSNSNGPWSG